MARTDTDKVINLTQLGIELGRVPLRSVAGTFVESDAVDQATLDAAVAAHVADSGYADPDPPAPMLQPLDGFGVTATLNAVLGVWPLADAANAVRLDAQALIDEALAWAEMASE